MRINVLALLIGMSTVSFAPQLLAKEVAYGQQKIVLSDTINPGNDFYRYVNEDWISKAKIPTGMPRINSFVDLYLNTEKQTSQSNRTKKNKDNKKISRRT